MGRMTIVYCDEDHDGKNTAAPAQILDIVVRIADPNDPSETRTLVGTLEVCRDHQEPIAGLAAMLEKHGTSLDEEAQQLLIQAVRPPRNQSAPPNPKVVCLDCTPPKLLKRSSFPSHANTQHGKKPGDLDCVPYVPTKHDSLIAGR